MIKLIHSMVFGRRGIKATLLDAVATTSNGEWVEVYDCNPLSIEFRGISGDTVQLRGSNQPTRPANSSDGLQLGADITGNSMVVISFPVHWIKAKISAYGAGTISAWLEGRV